MFANTKELDVPRLVTFIYGAPGSGKTRQAATFPSPVVLSPANEGGIVTLRGLDVPYFTLTGRSSLEQVLAHLERIQAREGADALPGETLVFDAVSHYAELVVEEIAQSRKAGMDQQGWGQLAAHFRAVHQRLRRLDMHIVYTALAEPIVSEGGGVIGQRPRLPGSARELVPSACDLLLYADARESTTRDGIYKVFSRPYLGAIARSRFAALPAEMVVGVDDSTTLWSYVEKAL